MVLTRYRQGEGKTVLNEDLQESLKGAKIRAFRMHEHPAFPDQFDGEIVSCDRRRVVVRYIDNGKVKYREIFLGAWLFFKQEKNR